MRPSSHPVFFRAAALLLLAAAAVRAEVPPVPDEVVALAPDPTPGLYLGRLRNPPSFWAELLAVDSPAQIVTVRPEDGKQVRHVRILPYADVMRGGVEAVPLESFQPGQRVELSVPPEGGGQYAVRLRDNVQADFNDNRWYRFQKIDPSHRELWAKPYAANENLLSAPQRFRVGLETSGLRGGIRVSPAEFRDGDMVQVRAVWSGEKPELEARELIDPSSMPLVQAREREATARFAAENGIPAFVEDVQGGRAELAVLRGFEKFLERVGEGEGLTLRPSIAPDSPPAAVTLASRRPRRTTLRVSVLGDPDALGALPRSTTVKLRPEK